MLGFLDVVPDKLVLKPDCLTSGQFRVCGRSLMGDGEAVAALSADGHLHRLIA